MDWSSILSTGIGILLGFLLKAVADFLSQQSRDAREDRLRFLDRRITASVDFGALINRLVASHRENRAMTVEVASVRQECSELSDDLKRTMEDITGGLASAEAMSDLSEEVRARMSAREQQLLDLIARRKILRGRIFEDSSAAHRANMEVTILCGAPVRSAANLLIDLVEAWESAVMDPQEPPDVKARRDAAYTTFMTAVRTEVGTRGP